MACDSSLSCLDVFNWVFSVCILCVGIQKKVYLETVISVEKGQEALDRISMFVSLPMLGCL